MKLFFYVLILNVNAGAWSPQFEISTTMHIDKPQCEAAGRDATQGNNKYNGFECREYELTFKG